MNIIKYDGLGETLYTDVLANKLPINIVTKPGYMKNYAFFATNYGGADREFTHRGSRISTPAGVAHFLEHKMFDTPDGGNALSVLSANGASPNAYTSNEITAYYYESTQGFYENLDTLLRFVSVPYFTTESVEKEQGIIGQEIRMVEDHPGHVVYVNLMKLLFENNPIRDGIIGTVESIAEITDETLYACHNVFYTPANMTLCVVGDVDPEKVIALASKALPAESGEAPGKYYGEAEPELSKAGRSEVSMEVAQPLFMIGTRFAPSLGDAALRERVVGGLALKYLYGHSSPMFTKLYAEGILNDSFGVETDFAAGAGMLFAEGESQKPELVLEAMAEAARLAGSGLDSALFGRVKKSGYGARLRSLGAFEALCAELADGQFNGYCALDAAAVLSEITEDEVAEFIRTRLDGGRLSLSVVRPIK